jgi:hypothetical protein
VHLWAALAAAWITPAAALAAALPAPPQTFDSSYAGPTGATLEVAAGQNLQAALNNAKPGDTVVLQAGATFRGPFKIPNNAGSGWIYVVSSDLANLPPPGTRVSPAISTNMPKILALNQLLAQKSLASDRVQNLQRSGPHQALRWNRAAALARVHSLTLPAHRGQSLIQQSFDPAQRMSRRHARLERHVTEHSTLLNISPAHQVSLGHLVRTTVPDAWHFSTAC